MSGAQPAATSSSGFFSNLFGQATSAADEPSASVLDEWNKYAASSSGPAQSDKLLSQLEEGSTSMQNYLNSSFTRVASGVKGFSGSVNSQVGSFSMPSPTQIAYFLAFLAGGVIFLVLAFSLFLPVIIIAPSKFAICFTIGSILILSGFVSLRGWQNQISHMLSKDRLVFTIVYLGSMGGTLYAALALHSYVLSLIFCTAQVVALLYYTLSYFPGGVYGLKYLLYTLQSAVMRCFLAIVGRR